MSDEQIRSVIAGLMPKHAGPYTVVEDALLRVGEQLDRLAVNVCYWRDRAYAAENVLWDESVAPGGEVCATCGVPVESEPCAAHSPALTAAGVEAGALRRHANDLRAAAELDPGHRYGPPEEYRAAAYLADEAADRLGDDGSITEVEGEQ